MKLLMLSLLMTMITAQDHQRIVDPNNEPFLPIFPFYPYNPKLVKRASGWGSSNLGTPSSSTDTPLTFFLTPVPSEFSVGRSFPINLDLMDSNSHQSINPITNTRYNSRSAMTHQKLVHSSVHHRPNPQSGIIPGIVYRSEGGDEIETESRQGITDEKSRSGYGDFNIPKLHNLEKAYRVIDVAAQSKYLDRDPSVNIQPEQLEQLMRQTLINSPLQHPHQQIRHQSKNSALGRGQIGIGSIFVVEPTVISKSVDSVPRLEQITRAMIGKNSHWNPRNFGTKIPLGDNEEKTSASLKGFRNPIIRSNTNQGIQTLGMNPVTRTSEAPNYQIPSYQPTQTFESWKEV